MIFKKNKKEIYFSDLLLKHNIAKGEEDIEKRCEEITNFLYDYYDDKILNKLWKVFK